MPNNYQDGNSVIYIMLMNAFIETSPLIAGIGYNVGKRGCAHLTYGWQKDHPFSNLGQKSPDRGIRYPAFYEFVDKELLGIGQDFNWMIDVPILSNGLLIGVFALYPNKLSTINSGPENDTFWMEVKTLYDEAVDEIDRSMPDLLRGYFLDICKNVTKILGGNDEEQKDVYQVLDLEPKIEKVEKLLRLSHEVPRTYLWDLSNSDNRQTKIHKSLDELLESNQDAQKSGLERFLMDHVNNNGTGHNYLKDKLLIRAAPIDDDNRFFREAWLSFEYISLNKTHLLIVLVNSKPQQKMSLREYNNNTYLCRAIEAGLRIYENRCEMLYNATKAAVDTIISRNHSHHIGSHVTPRSFVATIQERLRDLGQSSLAEWSLRSVSKKLRELEFSIPNGVIDDKAVVKRLKGNLRDLPRTVDNIPAAQAKDMQIVNLLKTRLDTYIQKKADFTAEIATEPLISTKTIAFFRELFVPFLENTLLLDGIGANEGVRYKSLGENRLKLRVSFNGKEVDFKWKCSKVETHEYSYYDYPYTGNCPLCEAQPSDHDDHSELKGIIGTQPDVQVAVPGPLGEYAFYAILENIIRNSIKHNRSVLERDHGHNNDLCICIDISELDDNDPDRTDFYRVRIWDDISNPCLCRIRSKRNETTSITLKDTIAGLTDRPIIDERGRLKKGAWGITEIKIMATLLSGSDDFLKRSPPKLSVKCKHQKGQDLLYYEFRVMKPREIAVITDVTLDPDKEEELRLSGIWYFKDFDRYKTFIRNSKSIASFHFVIIHKNHKAANKVINELSPSMPSRVICVTQSESVPAGIAPLTEQSILYKKIMDAQFPGTLITETWRQWVSFLTGRNGFQQTAMIVFLQQAKAHYPTTEWLKMEEKWKNDKTNSILSLEVAHTSGWSAPGDNQPILLYDRHAGVIKLNKELYHRIHFYEAIDKGSSDFINLFADPRGPATVYGFAEAALVRILVIDERIAERAHDTLSLDPSIKEWLKKEPKRMHVAQKALISLCTHLSINKDTKPLHASVSQKSPSLTLNITTKKDNDALQIDQMETLHSDTSVNCKGSYEVLIIHQGVLESLIRDKIQPVGYNEFVRELQNWVPYVVVTSGRGKPYDIPDNAKFLPFSLLEDCLLGEGIAKYKLTRIVMDLIRRDV